MTIAPMTAMTVRATLLIVTVGYASSVCTTGESLEPSLAWSDLAESLVGGVAPERAAWGVSRWSVTGGLYVVVQASTDSWTAQPNETTGLGCGVMTRATVAAVLVSDFDFDLPAELIAQQAAPRGTSRLLVLDRESGRVEHTVVAQLGQYLRAGDLLVVNDTRVFPARLTGQRVPSGGAVECLLLSLPAAGAGEAVQCEALMHPGQKLKPGALVRFAGAAGTLTGEVLEQRFFGRRCIRLRPDRADVRVDELVEALGHVPLPPYIRRADDAADRERYQTIFASARGSVAAPTAGLHFTQQLIDGFAARGIERVAITLHVGYGTFKPVRADRIEDHVVDPEAYEIAEPAAAAVNAARRDSRRVIAVGTTTTRALEDAAIRGGGTVLSGASLATAFIYPGFEFKVVDGLITNFHLPRSSLLMLVAALGGRERVLAAYVSAVAERYRFYSYGDAMLVI
jgi:S-adenosylmethionine:tRNA ribosyltransferase-isomerase